MNMLVNYPQLSENIHAGLYYFGGTYPPAPSYWTYPLWDGTQGQKAPGWEDTAFQMYPKPNNGVYTFNTAPGVYNNIGFQLDQSMNTGLGQVDYLISRAAIQPMDVRIEALMYAQNNSFFVIPGEWFNPDPNDTYANYYGNYYGNYVGKGVRPIGVNNSSWPFYEEPLDVRIVIYGGVSENVPASIADSYEWMEKWGWIPPWHGSNKNEMTTGYRQQLIPGAANAQGPQQGLTFIYDPQLSYPAFMTQQNGTVYEPRTDAYGRPLPLLPKLPVSPDTLYFGEPT
jgi:hypothetical protein